MYGSKIYACVYVFCVAEELHEVLDFPENRNIRADNFPRLIVVLRRNSLHLPRWLNATYIYYIAYNIYVYTTWRISGFTSILYFHTLAKALNDPTLYTF